MSKNTIGLRIKELRKEKGLTQKQLSEEIGVSRTTINKYENGYFTPSHKQIQSLSVILGCDESFLCEVSESTVDDMFIKSKIFDYLIDQAIKFRYPDANEYSLKVYKRHVEDAFNWIDSVLDGKTMQELDLDEIEPIDYNDLSQEEIDDIFKSVAEYERSSIEQENKTDK